MMDDIRLFLQQLRVICVKEIMAIWNDPATRRIVVVPVIILGFLSAMPPITIWKTRPMWQWMKAGAMIPPASFPALMAPDFSIGWPRCRIPMKWEPSLPGAMR